MKNEEFVSGQEDLDRKTPKVFETREGLREINIEKKTLVLLVGLPGSGKSTFAYNNFPIDSVVSTDRLRHELTSNIHNQVVSNEAFVLARTIVDARLKSGETIVVDAQNFTESIRNQFYKIADKYGAKVSIIYLNLSVDEAIERDKQRKRHVGADYIKRKKGEPETVVRDLIRGKNVDEIYVLDPKDISEVKVNLPEDYAEALESDKEILKAAEIAEVLLGAAEIGLVKKENIENRNSLTVPAGSLIKIPETDSVKTREFLDYNFMPHQIIDLAKLSKRLAVDLSDESLISAATFILKERTTRNLTSVITYPAGFNFSLIEEQLKSRMEKNLSKISFVDIPEDDVLNKSFISIERDPELKQEPLFILGDIQGCYKAMREHAGMIYRENLAERLSQKDSKNRLIVFVGDMADRGPYDVESIIYITALVRAGRAILIKGNHDHNLLKILKAKEKSELEGIDTTDEERAAGSRETRKTAEELRTRLSKGSIEKIIKMLEDAPTYTEWKDLVVVHGSLPRIPVSEEDIKEDFEEHVYGKFGEGFVGGRRVSYKIHNVVSKDPGILVVGGHTHDKPPAAINRVSGTVGLDVGVELRGKLLGMYYPELKFVEAEEPSVLKLYEILKGSKLPEGKILLDFVKYAWETGMIETKNGTDDFSDLTVINYSRVTDAGNLWNEFPVLRHFRGLIIDKEGNIVARPPEKSHKAGVEIPLENLKIYPKRVFEKANGSMGTVYFWNGKWRVATKFSFQNEDYTKPADQMLEALNKSTMDKSKTYIFEIILPNDSHIVDYGGKQELVLLKIIDTKTGEMIDWPETKTFAESMGVRTAEEMTEKFKGKTIAEIYEYAQEENSLANMEGLMLLYDDENGKEVTVKAKTREYDDKKFVRDRLDWEKLFDYFDLTTLNIPEDKQDKLLGYNYDNNFANLALEERINWIKERVNTLVKELTDLLLDLSVKSRQTYEGFLAGGIPKKAAVGKTLGVISKEVLAKLDSSSDVSNKGSRDSIMGFLRSLISGEDSPESKLRSRAFEIVKEEIKREEDKRPRNSYWLVPS